MASIGIHNMHECTPKPFPISFLVLNLSKRIEVLVGFRLKSSSRRKHQRQKPKLLVYTCIYVPYVIPNSIFTYSFCLPARIVKSSSRDVRFL